MNLEQALNYHSNCLICGSEMGLQSPDLADIRMILDEYGLRVQSGHKDIAVCFNYDGTYHKMKYWNNLYVRPLLILRECLNCFPSLEYNGQKQKVQFKSRSLGITSMSQSKDLHFGYQFSLFGDDSGLYTTNIEWEVIKFYNRKNYYYIKTNFIDSSTSFVHGISESHDGSSHKILNFPAVSTGGVNSTDQLLNKLKLYNVFS